MNEHTAGPWDAKRDPMPEGVEQYSVYEDATGIMIATVFGNRANANVVKAAPDMLAALKQIHEKRVYNFVAVRDAVNKAEGRA